MTEHRDDLVRTRTQTINPLHALLIKLLPPGLPRGLSTQTTVMALPRIRPTTTVVRTLRLRRHR